jgi:hypothetical protein
LTLREAGLLVGAKLHLLAGPKHGAKLRLRRLPRSRDPDIAFGVDVGLVAFAPLDWDLDDPDDGRAGA